MPTPPGRQLVNAYTVAVAAIVFTAAVRVALDPLLGDAAPLVLFLIPVAVAAAVGGFGPALLATGLGVLVGVVLFPPGRHPSRPHGLGVNLVVRGVPFTAVGLSISLFAARARTARQRAERSADAAEGARREAEQAGRMKDEFLATLGHELRTPLNAILGWTQILTGPGVAADDVAEAVAVIDRNARAQARIVEDVLDMSRIISGKLRLEVAAVDVSALVRAGVDTVRPAADAKGIHLDVRVPPAPAAAAARGDAARLQQVFWNLLSNAVKFTPAGGRVTVAVHTTAAPAVVVAVTDTGEGIDPAFLPYVFDRFRQQDGSTTRRHGGLGLGLSIVKQLVELHGGRVTATSDGLGRGATFTAELPAPGSPDDAGGRSDADHDGAGVGARAGAAAPRVAGRLSGVTVVVVDDEPDGLAAVRRVLEGHGAAVRTATSAAAALALVRADPPAVLVSDIGMPVEDGHGLIRRVRSLPPAAGGQVPAIALTAYARPADRTVSLDAGFQRHLPKPFASSDLIDAVAELARATQR